MAGLGPGFRVLSRSMVDESDSSGDMAGCPSAPRLIYFLFLPDSSSAEVAELADAQASGACPRKGVEVQILSSAPFDSVALIPRSWRAQPFRMTEANGVPSDHT